MRSTTDSGNYREMITKKIIFVANQAARPIWGQSAVIVQIITVEMNPRLSDREMAKDQYFRVHLTKYSRYNRPSIVQSVIRIWTILVSEEEAIPRGAEGPRY